MSAGITVPLALTIYSLKLSNAESGSDQRRMRLVSNTKLEEVTVKTVHNRSSNSCSQGYENDVGDGDLC